MHILENYLTRLNERIPFTTGRVKIEIGETTDVGEESNTSNLTSTHNAIPCIIINEIRIFTFKAAFLFYSPSLMITLKNGGSCKGVLVGGVRGQNDFENTVNEEGTGVTRSFFFGREKPARTFDTLQRFFNDKGGVRVNDFDGLHSIDSNQVLEFTVEKNIGRKNSVRYMARLRVHKDRE